MHRNQKPGASQPKLCFDVATSTLVTESHYESPAVEFQDFRTIDQKVFPGRIIFRSERNAELEVADISVVKSSCTPDVFVPPDGAAAFPTCDEPTRASKVKDVAPAVPTQQLRLMRAAEVYLYGIVGTGGSVENIAVEYSPHVVFTTSAVDAVKQWRYAPASCGGKAVPAEGETSMRYFIP